jgi:hypothetical protein
LDARGAARPRTRIPGAADGRTSIPHDPETETMRKLKLDPEMLAVESFAADEGAPALRGTVEAQSYVTFGMPNGACSEPASQQCQETDFHWYTCGNSCINMCFHTGVEACCVD